MMFSNKQMDRVVSDPLSMALVIVVVLFIIQGLVLLLRPMLTELMDQGSSWMVSMAMILVFIMFNAISTFVTKELVWHWSRSIYGLLLLGVIGSGLAWLISGKSLYEIQGLSDIMLLLFIGFMTLKTITTTINKVVAFTQRRDEEKLKDDENN